MRFESGGKPLINLRELKKNKKSSPKDYDKQPSHLNLKIGVQIQYYQK